MLSKNVETTRNGFDDDFIIMNELGPLSLHKSFSFNNFVTISVCLSGHAELNYHLKQVKIEEREMMIIYPDYSFEYISTSKDFQCMRFMFSLDFARSLESKNTLPIRVLLMSHPVIPIKKEEQEILVDYYSIIHKTMSRKGNPNAASIIKHLLNAMFFETIHFEFIQNHLGEISSRQEELFTKFYQLVMEFHRESREVTFYADKLCISPKYLSNQIHQLTSRFAKEWIDVYVIWDAKTLLQSKENLTIQQVSDILGFPDQYSFGKYFKKKTGMPPTTYKQFISN